MRVAIDVDGVIRDLVGSLQRVYRKYYPGKWAKPVVRWEMGAFFEIGDAILPFMFEEHAWEVFAGADPYPGALEMIWRIRDLGHEITYLTHQPESTVEPTRYWMDRYGFLGLGELQFAKDKGLAMALMGLDVLIDDGPHNLEAAVRAGKRAIAIDRPWNREYEGEGARTGDDVIAILKEIVTLGNKVVLNTWGVSHAVVGTEFDGQLR